MAEVEYIDPNDIRHLVDDFKKIVESEDICGAFWVVLDAEERLEWRGYGGMKKDLLWALEAFKLEVLSHKIEEIADGSSS